MKKEAIQSTGKILMPLLLMSIFFLSCANDDNNPATIVGSDSVMSAHNTDTMESDHTRGSGLHDTVDNRVIANPDSLRTTVGDTASRATSGTKAKKGKITILPADTKAKSGAMEMDKEGFYASTEILPAFPGGQRALERFFEDNIQYPETAVDNGTEGTVKLIFNVDENGKIYQPQPVGDKVGNGIEEEAIRVFSKMPRWNPGKIKGKNVKTRFTLPIRFQLD